MISRNFYQICFHNLNHTGINFRFTIKAPPPLPRKDEQLGHVIISEKKNEAVKKHQVN